MWRLDKAKSWWKWWKGNVPTSLWQERCKWLDVIWYNLGFHHVPLWFHHKSSDYYSGQSVLYRSWPKLSQVDNVLDRCISQGAWRIEDIDPRNSGQNDSMIGNGNNQHWYALAMQIWESCSGQIHAHSLVFHFLVVWDLDSHTRTWTDQRVYLATVSSLHPGHQATSSWEFIFVGPVEIARNLSTVTLTDPLKRVHNFNILLMWVTQESQWCSSSLNKLRHETVA